MTKILYFYQKLFFKKKDLEPAVKFGDNALSKLSILSNFLYDFGIPEHKSLEICGIIFSSPLIGASFKADPKILDIWMRMGLGGLIFKTIMKEKREGNAQPRLQDANIENINGLYNSLGLPGMGIEEFLIYLQETNLWEYKRPLGISIGGNSVSEYTNNLLKLEPFLKKCNNQYFYELNISCPNTKSGRTICHDPSLLEILLINMRKNTDAPLSVKISPDISNSKIKEIADLCTSFEKIIINAGNTQYKTPSQVGVKRHNFSMNGGGLSGPPLFKRTVEMVKLLNEFDNPIMATGGISNIQHLSVLKENGASLFGMASSLVLNPYCIPKIHSEINKL